MAWHINETDQLGTLTPEQVSENSIELAKFMIVEKGWKLGAVCALLGNIHVESGINPGQYEFNKNYDIDHYGFGLVQWTPGKKYIQWAQLNGYFDKTDPIGQMVNIDLAPEGQWIEDYRFPISYDEFKQRDIVSDLDTEIAYLTEAFMRNYERPREDAAIASLPDRISYAKDRYIDFSGIPFKKKFPIYFYLKHR